jgi:hypothetical protein
MEDICEAKHRGNSESVAASGDKDAQRERVFDAIAASGDDGLTCDELSAISGRFSELKKDGLIEMRGRRQTRSGSLAGVYVVAA